MSQRSAPRPSAVAAAAAAAAAAALRGPEPLEARLLWSVSYDANGYTVVAPSSDSRVIYLSSTAGLDTNSGLSVTSPVATMAKAQSLVRTGYPDEILLKRGDTFHGAWYWTASGRSVAEPMLIGAYGTGGPAGRRLRDEHRRHLRQRAQPGVVPGRDRRRLRPAVPGTRPPPRTCTRRTGPTPARTGSGGTRPGGNVLIEDCSFTYSKFGLDIETLPEQTTPCRRRTSRSAGA